MISVEVYLVLPLAERKKKNSAMANAARVMPLGVLGFGALFLITTLISIFIALMRKGIFHI